MPDLSLRRAQPSDAPTVAHLVRLLLGELAAGELPALEPVLDSVRAVLASDRVQAFLAVRAGIPVGIMTLNECMAIYAGGLFGEISELYVSPESRSCGVARRLVDQAVIAGHARGWRRIEVGAPAQPAWARTLAFYRANGFEEVGPRLRRLI